MDDIKHNIMLRYESIIVFRPPMDNVSETETGFV